LKSLKWENVCVIMTIGPSYGSPGIALPPTPVFFFMFRPVMLNIFLVLFLSISC